MRRFFSFRSSPAPSSNTNKISPDSNCEKVHWEKPSQNGSADENEYHVRTPEDSPGSHRRKFSPSPLAISSHLREEAFSSPLRNERTSPCSFSSNSRHHCKHANNTRSSTPPVLRNSGKKNEVHELRRTSSYQSMNDAGCLGKDFNNTSRNSPCNSPVPLRCRTARVTQITNCNNLIDHFIDGEQQHERKSTLSSDFENEDFVAEKTLLNSKRPPRSHSTAPSSPTFSKQNMRSYSFGEARDLHPSIPEWAADKLRAASPAKSKKKFDRLAHALPVRSKMASRDYDSETTTTVEDIYEDRSYSQHDSSLYVASLNDTFSDRPNGNGSFCSDGLEDYLASQRKKYFIGDISRRKHELSPSLNNHEDEIDDQLATKLKEAEEKFICQSDHDLEIEKLENCNVCIPRLLQMIKNINGDRRNLVLELLTQIQCQISERSSSKKALKQAIIDLDTRTRRLEKEKNELQLSLERELDRRSNDWSVKLEKFQTEEQRLRERVRELAEQNVHLQREVTSVNSREEESKKLIVNLEAQLNEMTAMVKEVNLENQNLRQASSELEARSHSAVVDRDCIKRTYKENENRDFHKTIARFQKMCKDQEKTIAGLRKECSDEIAKQPSDTDDIVSRLRLELIRLTGVEQTLRKELESYSCEMEELRHESVRLLEHLQKTEAGCGLSVFKLNQELQRQVKDMESTGLSMVNAYREFCSELLEFLRNKHHQKLNRESEEYSVFEFNRKLQNLKETSETWRRRFLFISTVLGEKSRLGDMRHEEHSSCGSFQELTLSSAENDLELELKAERLLTKVLREKMCSKELEIERQHEDIASLLRGSEISKNEIQRLKEEVCSLSHKATNMDLQMSRKDENFKQLELDLKECKKDSIANHSILAKVSEERDSLWKDVQRLKEDNMLLNHENESLKMKINKLDEEILVKEGEFSILRDTIDNLTCSPSSLRERGPI